MRCIREIMDGRTAFLVLELDAAEREASYRLGWGPIGDGMGVTFAPDTRYLYESFANFMDCAPIMIRQLLHEAPVPWEAALSATLEALAPLDLDWYLVGSGALAVRGIDVLPGDLDLVTSSEDAPKLERALRAHLVQPLQASPGWVAESFTRAFLGVRVEWLGGPAPDAAAPADFGPTAAARLETVRWRDFTLRVSPLDLALATNRRRGRTEQAERIEAWLQRGSAGGK